MEQKQVDLFIQWFGAYIQRYFSMDGDDFLNENLHLKECHTHRVCGYMRALAENLGLSENEYRIAETVALFHDIGRFEQFKKYRTYKDTISEDHALLGLRILHQERILESLDPAEKKWIEQAVEYHNKKDLPDGMDPKTELFAKMVRDTDKLDIYYVVIENHRKYFEKPDTFRLEVEFPNEPYCSPEIIEAIEQGKLVDYRLLNSMNDILLLQIGWVYDIYYNWTLNRIVEQKYLNQLIRWLPELKEIKKAIYAVESYVKNRLAQER